MDTSRWRLLSWFVLASVVVTGLSLIYEAVTRSGCGSDCAGKGASYKAGARLGNAVISGPTPFLLMLVLVLGLVWLATSRWMR